MPPNLCAHAHQTREAIRRAEQYDPPPPITTPHQLGIDRPGVIVNMTDTLAATIALCCPIECLTGRCHHDKQGP
jgi:hypothetical protein